MEFSRAMPALQETLRRIGRRLQRLVGLHSHWEAEHYRILSDTHMRRSQFYQAQLYHAWRVIREQSKGLNRQARKIRRLQKLRHNAQHEP